MLYVENKMNEYPCEGVMGRTQEHGQGGGLQVDTHNHLEILTFNTSLTL